ncbi:S1 family peptidase [Rubripirellula reticaptiva]|uniref:Trypsin n=1 Tax=Rubripirellula reticaptiva TaxID=2528013 RepID=A0A5C6EK37_9BACT|nr:trypsin-like serine protease [Rubripirellula reticaptiva]TWU47991.1 Trypsin [Rubripirellula reticaptiva]
MHYQSRPVSAFCLAIGLLAACLAQTPVTGQNFFPKILVGTPTDDYESVGIVGSITGGGFCTGTLISSTDVLTAAHCAFEVESSTEGTFEVGGQLYLTSAIFIHPDYNPVTYENDIAIFRLSEPVADIEPSTIFRGTPIVGDLLSIVGFGGTGTAIDGNDGTFGIKRVGITTIDDVTATVIEWLYDDPSEANTASGDSGGPGFLFVDGEPFIASITSGGSVFDSTLGDVAFNTRVDAFADWIDITLLEAVPTDTSDPAPSEPDTNSPSDEDADEDADQDTDDAMTACEKYLSKPFPFLNFLIDFLTSLLQSLTEVTDTAVITDVTETPDATDTVVDDSDSVTETVSQSTPHSATHKVRRNQPQRRGRSGGR